MTAAIEEGELRVEGVHVFYRRVAGKGTPVVHDWGGLALVSAQRRPDLVEKLVVINVVPLLPGYSWHWVAQLWRRHGLPPDPLCNRLRRVPSKLQSPSRPSRRPLALD